MLIKYRRTTYFLWIGIAILLSLIFFSVDRIQLKEEIAESKQRFLSLPLGLSSLSAAFSCWPECSQVGIAQIFYESPALLKRVVKNIFRFNYAEAKPIDLFIDIPWEGWSQIQGDRRRAIERGLGSGFSEVGGTLTYLGKQHRAKIRLKGDFPAHFSSKSRMSLRVELKGRGHVSGFSRFSLHKPSVRNHPHDQAFQSYASELGLLTSKHAYLNVYLNGENWGVMNIEEHISKELLEKQRVRDSLVFSFGDQRVLEYEVSNMSFDPQYRLNWPQLSTKVFQGNKKLQKRVARAQYTYIAEQILSSDNYPHLLETTKFCTAYLAAAVWNGTHTLLPANSRFYLNPYSMRLEPILTDQDYFVNFGQRKIDFFEDVDGPFLYRDAFMKALGTEAVQLEDIWRKVTKTAQKIPELVNGYSSIFVNDHPNVKNSITPSMLAKNTSIVSDTLKDYMRKINVSLDKSDDLSIDSTNSHSRVVYVVHTAVQHYENGILKIHNLLPHSIVIKGIYHHGKLVRKENIEVRGYDASNGIYVYNSGITGWQDESIEVESEYKGTLSRARIGQTLVSKTNNPLLRGNQFNSIPIQKDGEDYVISRGDWQIDSALTIVGNLRLKPGTTLRFSRDAYMIVQGAIFADGTRSNPIRFIPSDTGWKGLYVLRGRQPSILRHVEISGTTGLTEGVLDLTGGVTFYQTQVELANVNFKSSLAEDALNIVDSRIYATDVTVERVRSDAIDIDFSRGKLENITIEIVGGDGIDISGSKLSIGEITVRQVWDKAVSIGELSEVSIRDLDVSNAGVGVVVKDGSRTIVRSMSSKGMVRSPAMTYIKKPYYSSAILEIDNLIDSSSKSAQSQNGTTILIGEEHIKNVDIDVKALYESGRMKK